MSALIIEDMSTEQQERFIRGLSPLTPVSMEEAEFIKKQRAAAEKKMRTLGIKRMGEN